MCLYVDLEGDCSRGYHFGKEDQNLAKTAFRVPLAYTELCLNTFFLTSPTISAWGPTVIPLSHRVPGVVTLSLHDALN